MEDNLKFLENGRQPQNWKTTSFILENGRQPKFKANGRRIISFKNRRHQKLENGR
jgi:hypothetical protein